MGWQVMHQYPRDEASQTCSLYKLIDFLGPDVVAVNWVLHRFAATGGDEDRKQVSSLEPVSQAIMI